MTDFDHGLPAEDVQDMVPLARVYTASPNGEDVVMASSSWELTLCPVCNNIHLWFKNPNGEYFATGTFSMESADKLIQRIAELQAELSGRH